MRVGFYAWNLFQIQHAAQIIDRLPGSTIIFHERNRTAAADVLGHPTVAHLAGRAAVFRGTEIARAEADLDALVFQTAFPGIGAFRRPLLVGLQYSMAKERHQYGIWRGLADLTLVYGGYSAERLRHFTPVAEVGNPRFDDPALIPCADLSRLIPGFRPDRPTLVYLPTWGELSSIPDFGDAVTALGRDYNVFAQPHHLAARIESRRAVRAVKSVMGASQELVPDVGEVIQAADLVLSDFSGAIFDALLFGKPVVLLQSAKAAGNGAKLGPESIELARRHEIGPVVDDPADLAKTVADVLSGHRDYSAANARLRKHCFAITAGSAEAAARAIADSIVHRPARPPYQDYLNGLLRDPAVLRRLPGAHSPGGLVSRTARRLLGGFIQR